jgi:hypothetical protein
LTGPKLSFQHGDYNMRNAQYLWQNGELSRLSKQAATLEMMRIAWAERHGAFSNNIHPNVSISHELLNEAISIIENSRPLRYRDLPEELLLTLSGKLLFDKNLYTPFSLNFSDRLIGQASKNKRGFKKYVTDSLRRTLSDEFQTNIQFIMAFEISPSEKIHAHGVIAVEFSTPNIRRAWRALRRVNVDRVVKGVKFSKPSNGVYWCSNYLCKSIEQTRQHLNESPIYLDDQTRREIKTQWESTKPTPTTPKPVDFDALRQSAAQTRTKLRELIVADEKVLSITTDPINPLSLKDKLSQIFESSRQIRELERREWANCGFSLN